MQNKTGAERLACSVTRLGDFLKFFATNSLTKVAQKDCRLLEKFYKDELV